jgi:hypothetical protein
MVLQADTGGKRDHQDATPMMLQLAVCVLGLPPASLSPDEKKPGDLRIEPYVFVTKG